MNSLLQPWQLLLLILAGWINHREQDVIEYIRAENRVLREKALQNAVSEFLTYYHQERNHQGLNNQLIQPSKEVGRNDGAVACRERLGGILRYYYR